MQQQEMVFLGVIFVLIAMIIGLIALLVKGRTKSQATIAERFEATMKGWSRITHSAETTLLDNVAATTPWLGPVIPAAIAYANLREFLGFENWLALTAAVCIEFLGLAAVQTTFQLWQYNEEKRAKDQEAPVLWAVGTGGAYITVVLLVNIVLEASAAESLTGQVIAGIAVKALLSLLSVVSAFVLALRAQHNRRLVQQSEDKEQRADAQRLAHANKQVEKLQQQLAEAQQKNKELQQENKLSQQSKANLQQASEQVEKLQEAVNKKNEQLQQASEKITALQQKNKELQQNSTEAHHLGAKLQQAQTQLQQLREEISELQQLKKMWATLPLNTQAAAVMHTTGRTVRDVAGEYELEHTGLYRHYKKMYPDNGNGAE